MSSYSSPELPPSRSTSWINMEGTTPTTYQSSLYINSIQNPRRHRTSSTVSSPSYSRANSIHDYDSYSPPRRFKTIAPPFGLPPSLKPKKPIKKFLFFAVFVLTFSTFFLLHIDFPNHSIDDLSTSSNRLHSVYPNVFDTTTTSPDLTDYYKERDAILEAEIAAKNSQRLKQTQSNQQQYSVLHSNTIPQHLLIQTTNVSNSFYKNCMLSHDTNVLHDSLRRGPDQKELQGRKSAKQPRDFDDTFSTIDRRRYYFDADRPAALTIDNLGADLDKDFDDAVQVAKSIVEKDTKAQLQSLNVPVAYMRTTRQDGLQTIINIGGYITKKDGNQIKKMLVRRMVTVTKGYGKPCDVSLVRPKELVKLHVLVPYSSRPNRLSAFFTMFDRYFKSTNSNLMAIIISTTNEEKELVENISKNFTSLTNQRLSIVTSKGDSQGKFSRAVALREAVKLVPQDDILFISDADLLIGGNFLQNCRVNVVKGSQVWFPVMFSLYPYGNSLSSHDGLWRRSSYGMACMYQKDFTSVGGFGGNEEVAFSGWGSEDVTLYNRFRDNKHYAVLRTLEPGLQHQWHGKECEHNEHYENCMRTVYMTIGSQDVIAKLMARSKVDISSLTKDATPV